jgi:hypothetical protein
MNQVKRTRGPGNSGNPWSETNGCEVNVCQAKQCDPGRMKICTLRRTWLEMTSALAEHMERAKSDTIRKIYWKRLEKLGYYKVGKHD